VATKPKRGFGARSGHDGLKIVSHRPARIHDLREWQKSFDPATKVQQLETCHNPVKPN